MDKFISDCLYQLTDNDDDGHVKYIATMLFASLCRHHEYLAENLHPQNLLRNYKCFRNAPERIRECVKIAYPWDKTRETLRFSGVPPYVLLMEDMRDLNIHMNNIQDSLGGHLRMF